VSPTYLAPARFRREFQRLDPAMQRAFLAARDTFVTALSIDPPSFPPQLRVKRVRGHAGVWEFTFAADGRATFQYGSSEKSSEPHIVWRRVGTHDVLREP
jgi:hypothetical protein